MGLASELGGAGASCVAGPSVASLICHESSASGQRCHSMAVGPPAETAVSSRRARCRVLPRLLWRFHPHRDHFGIASSVALALGETSWLLRAIGAYCSHWGKTLTCPQYGARRAEVSVAGQTRTSARRPARPGDPAGDDLSLRVGCAGKWQAGEAPHVLREFRVDWSGPLLRPLGLPHHRHPPRLEARAGVLPELLREARAAHFPALLRRPRSDAPGPAALRVVRHTGPAAPPQRPMVALGVLRKCVRGASPRRVHLERRLASPRGAVVPGRRGALLPPLAAPRSSCRSARF